MEFKCSARRESRHLTLGQDACSLWVFQILSQALYTPVIARSSRRAIYPNQFSSATVPVPIGPRKRSQYSSRIFKVSIKSWEMEGSLQGTPHLVVRYLGKLSLQNLLFQRSHHQGVWNLILAGCWDTAHGKPLLTTSVFSCLDQASKMITFGRWGTEVSRHNLNGLSQSHQESIFRFSHLRCLINQ